MSDKSPSSIPEERPIPKGPLRYDGLYQSSLEVLAGTASRDYIRFFPDGTVSQARSTGTATDVIRWLAPSSNGAHGTYKVDGTALRFDATSYDDEEHTSSTAHYEGRIVDREHLELRWRSFSNGQQPPDVYEFVPK